MEIEPNAIVLASLFANHVLYYMYFVTSQIIEKFRSGRHLSWQEITVAL